MIEAAMRMFEETITFKIVANTVTDDFYGKNSKSYTTTTSLAVVMPHTNTTDNTETDIGSVETGEIDVFVKNLTLKCGDIAVYNSKEYTVTKIAEWYTILGDYNHYVCKN
jgi:hypothetical protein